MTPFFIIFLKNIIRFSKIEWKNIVKKVTFTAYFDKLQLNSFLLSFLYEKNEKY